MLPPQSARAVLVACLVSGGGNAYGILFQSTSDATFNTTAPSGELVGSGWQYQGVFGRILGTVISPTHFITAAHGDSSENFLYEGLSHNILSRSFILGTDLMVAEVDGYFHQWAALYSAEDPIGSQAIIIGLGGPRGQEIQNRNGQVIGWQTGLSDGIMRWGTNRIEGVQTFEGLGDLLIADFGFGATEAGLSIFDSGGGAFILDEGEWKLAGITYGADRFAVDPTGAGQFTGALLDATGYYRREDGIWAEQNSSDPGSRYYFSSISASADQINNLIHIPEPSGISLMAGVGSILALRRRRV